MSLFLDAWLDRPAPYLQIIDSETRLPVARFEAMELQRLFSEGIIDPNDLNHSDPRSQQALIQELLVAACCCRIRREEGCEECHHASRCPRLPSN